MDGENVKAKVYRLYVRKLQFCVCMCVCMCVCVTMDASGECAHVCVCDNVYKWCMQWFRQVCMCMCGDYTVKQTNKPKKSIYEL